MSGVYPSSGGAFEKRFLHVQGQKPSGTTAGTFTAGAWRTRDLNTVLSNQVSGASLASNQVTLPAGTYFCRGSAEGYSVAKHATRLYDLTAAVVLAMGRNVYAHTGASGNHSALSGRFTLAVPSVLELQHRCESSKSVNGFGSALGVQTEIYANLELWKVG